MNEREVSLLKNAVNFYKTAFTKKEREMFGGFSLGEFGKAIRHRFGTKTEDLKEVVETCRKYKDEVVCFV